MLKILVTCAAAVAFCSPLYAKTLDSRTKGNYPIVDTGIKTFYSDREVIAEPGPGDPYFGQDAHFQDNTPSYTDNGDGTVIDNITGLMWQQKMEGKLTYQEAVNAAKQCSLGGHSDWRIPTVKELYSLILFTGRVEKQRPIATFIDTDYFRQPLGNPKKRERPIDAQTWSATTYVGKTMRNDTAVFGVNFVDGRIKGYPKIHPRSGKANRMYFRFVRGNPEYGNNHFVDNEDGTVSDLATGLMWQQGDSGKGMDWQQALSYANTLTDGSHTDWRLPNAKELHSIVDYSRSPQTHGSAAIDPVFVTSTIQDLNGDTQFPYFWTSTTHQDGRNPYDSAVYIAFGGGQGKM